jgi:hypothetical protein
VERLKYVPRRNEQNSHVLALCEGNIEERLFEPVQGPQFPLEDEDLRSVGTKLQALAEAVAEADMKKLFEREDLFNTYTWPRWQTPWVHPRDRQRKRTSVAGRASPRLLQRGHRSNPASRWLALRVRRSTDGFAGGLTWQTQVSGSLDPNEILFASGATKGKPEPAQGQLRFDR